MARQPKRSGGANAVARRPEIRVGGRWRLRNWRLRTKLIVVLLIPTITVLSLVGLQVRQDLGQAEGLAQLAARGRVDDKVNAVVQELQRERDLTVVYVAQGRKGDLSQLRDQRDRVDAAIGDFSKELDADRDLLSRDGASELEATMSRLNVLTGLRYSGETSNLPAAQVLSSYSDLISGILDLSDEAVADITDPELTRLRLATNALARVKDQMSIKRALLGDALEQREMSGDVLRSLLGADAELSAALSDYRKFATPDQQREYDATVTGAPVEQGNNIFESAVTRGENGQSLSIPDARQWDTDATDTIDLAYRVQQSLQTLTQQECDTLAAGARRAAIENAGIVLGVLVLCVVLAVIITRSLLRPLRLLRRTALEVAERRLPAAVEDILADPNPDIVARRTVAPVPVFTREEFGQVARAFDVVHSEAVRLAGDQALLRENINAMFVNLSRRSQDLVERQLSVLDRMEAGEQDPDTLGGLFELDHLATRMRRNSENLLVLAGQNPGDGPAEPAAAEEIIGAALSEVEHYQRIELTPAPELAVRGEACGDLVHLISELLENATLYSPPHTTVAVVSATARDGAWEVHITDRGAGMPEPEIRRANSRLTEPPAVDVEVSRRMGLFVVATLARRHDIRASLHAADTGGLEAVVVVPASLIVPLPPGPAPVPAPVPAEPMAEPAPELVPEPIPVPIPEPELEPEPEPEPEQTLALPAVPGAARRAPVDEPVMSWPDEDDDLRLPVFDDDEPTDRMPAYQEVLTQWFHLDQHLSVRGELPRSEPAEPVSEPASVYPEGAAWPEPAGPETEPATAEPEEPVWPREEDVAVLDGDGRASRSESGVEVTSGELTLRLDPEDVRRRMARLQDGFDRARDARSGR